MITFSKILSATEGEIIKIFHRYCDQSTDNNQMNLMHAAKKFNMHPTQINIALGFNSNIYGMEEIAVALGYDSTIALLQECEHHYVNDIYEHLPMANIMMLYNATQEDPKLLQRIQKILKNRLANIEGRIEETVNSRVIDKYKMEMKAIYTDHIADIEFAEDRLNNLESGFRALLNEACMIAESKLIPVGDIFFRATILPEEKRKLLNRNLIPLQLVESRLQDEISQQEQRMLQDFLALNKKRN